MSLSLSPYSSPKNIPSAEDVKHIVSWFAETEYPIENPEMIKDIRKIGELISFWYGGRLCDCPSRKREEADDVSFVPMESFGIEELKMRVKMNTDRFVTAYLDRTEPVKNVALAAA